MTEPSEKRAYERAKADAARQAQRIAFGHPVQWPGPRGEGAQDAYERDIFSDEMDEEYDDD